MRLIFILLSLLLLLMAVFAMARMRRTQHLFSPIFAWLIGLTIFIVVPLCLLSVNGGYDTPGIYNNQGSFAHVSLAEPAIRQPFMIIWLTLAAIFGFALLLSIRSTPPPPQRSAINERGLRRLLYTATAIIALDYALDVWLTGGIGNFLVSHWYLRQERELELFGGLAVVLTHVEQALQTVFTAAAMLHANWQIRNRQFRPITNLCVTGFLIAQVVMTGNRIFMAVYLTALAVSLWYYGRRRAMAMLLAAAPVILLAFSVWSGLRHNLSTALESLPAYLHADIGNRTMVVLMDTTEGIDAMLLLRIIQDFGHNTPYLYGATYMHGLTAFLPHNVVPDRLPGFSVLLAAYYLPDDITSLNATEIGEIYANFGIWCLLLGPILTLLFYLWSNHLFQITNGDTLTAAVAFVCVYWCTRVTLEDAAIMFVLAWSLGRLLILFQPGFDNVPAGSPRLRLGQSEVS